MKTLMLIALSMPAVFASCTPSGHLGGTYNPATGESTATVDIELRKLNKNLEELNQKLVAPKALDPK